MRGKLGTNACGETRLVTSLNDPAVVRLTLDHEGKPTTQSRI
jgi:hypothetical protein